MLRKASASLFLATALLAASCGNGGDAAEIAGSWREPALVPGPFHEMTLLANGNAIAGTGVAHDGAGGDQPFTVSGSPSQLTFTFTSGQPDETYAVAQPDANDLRLTGPRTILFVREQ